MLKLLVLFFYLSSGGYCRQTCDTSISIILHGGCLLISRETGAASLLTPASAIHLATSYLPRIPTSDYEFQQWRPNEAAKLPPHRVGVDHQIELKKDAQGMEMKVPYVPLYDLSREELLVLRKTPNNLLDKGYIRASKSEAGAPVLFARKPGGGLRFCCDYRGLNAATVGTVRY